MDNAIEKSRQGLISEIDTHLYRCKTDARSRTDQSQRQRR